jgi:uroporphyrinogen-III synthase
VDETALSGWTVGVTADRRAEEQIELLQRIGARVLHGPTIRTQPLGSHDETSAALHEVIARPPDVLVLTTGLGTRAVVEVAETLGIAEPLLHALSQAVVYARGPKACGAANTVGLTVSWQAPSATSAEMIDHLRELGVEGRRIAVQLDGRAEPVLGDALRALGAEVVDIPVYRWTLPEDTAPAQRLVDAICERKLDAVTFTSTPAWLNLLELAGDARGEVIAALGDSVAWVSVGSVCTSAARDHGVEPAVEPGRHRLGAMAQALGRHARKVKESSSVKVGASDVSLHAASVVVDGAAIDLTEQERAVLAALLDRPGAVVAKRDLLQQVASPSADVHAAEAAVSRLRARLDGRLRIQPVPRRGYALTGPDSSA